MECNKDEAKRAMDIAEKKLSENDYDGAKKFVKMAENLYPKLDGLKQVLMMINVYISAARKINGGRDETDYYGVLGVDHLADDETVKKQYKKLALLLHPDKNKCKGAEGAFKLVSEAWCLLSDKVKRNTYDQKRKSKEVAKNGMPKPPNAHKPASTNGNHNAKHGVNPSAKASRMPKPPYPHKQASSSGNQNVKHGVVPNAKAKASSFQPASVMMPKPVPYPLKPDSSNGLDPSVKVGRNQPASRMPKPVPKKGHKRASPSVDPSANATSNRPAHAVTFWTMCNGCKTQGEYLKERYLDKAILCPNCGKVFVATEKTTWESFVRQVSFSSSLLQNQQQQRYQNKATNANGASSSSSGRVFNFSSSSQQCSAQNTRGGSGTYSSSTRGLEELLEVVADNEKILKKPKIRRHL